MKLPHKIAARVFTVICLVAILTVMMGSAVTAAAAPPPAGVKNIIILIADGAGFNHFLATDYYQFGAEGQQVYQKFPVKLAVSTYEYEWKTWNAAGTTPLSFDIYGYDSTLFWSDFGYAIQTNPLNPAFINNATDSASSGTAMATGYKTRDGVLGMDINGKKVPNIIELAESLGKSTGVVSSVNFTHATPAAFVAHNISRSNLAAIGQEMLYQSGVDVIMGAGSPDFNNEGGAVAPAPGSNTNIVGGWDTWQDISNDWMLTGADANGDGTPDVWNVIRDRSAFQAMAAGATPSRVFGLAKARDTLQHNRGGDVLADAFVVPYNPNVPTLEEMTKAALNVLDNNATGFFLMVEGAAIDWAGHFYRSGRLIEEFIDFNKSIEAVTSWVETNSNWDETLVIVTADHETGYLWGPKSMGINWAPIVNNGAGSMPGMAYYSDIGGFAWHSNSLVPLWAKGPCASSFVSFAINTDPVYGPYLDNTDIFTVMANCLVPKPAPTQRRWNMDSTLAMERSGTQSGFVVMSQNDGNIWHTDQSAQIDVVFPAGDWVVELATQDWDGPITIQIGESDGTVFNPFHANPVSGVRVGNTITFTISAGGTVPKGQFLALKVVRGDGIGPSKVNTAGKSFLLTPDTDPGYPVPELSAGILLALGLAALGGYLLIRRKKTLRAGNC
ncbi:MAG TPA: alkaline phosphatase [Dehalococcoidales bacterium]|nr:alkaline phosphatase [Dehalococcoidales bacterium]